MDFSHIVANNLVDHMIISNYDKEEFKNVPLCVGIDEAGRGPVLGPMVYSALFCHVDKQETLKEMKCADSKTLTEKDREKIFDVLNEANKFCGFAIKALSPNSISTNMLGRAKYNLNDYSHDTAMSLIDTLLNKEKLNVKIVYLDTVGDPNKYQAKLKERFKSIDIKVSKKADSLFPCVSAASICAKVTRDYLLKNWKFSENIEFTEYGSGYPGDPLVRKFLNAYIDEVFGFTKLVRFSWSTASQIIDKKCIEVKWPDNFSQDNADDDEDENGKKKKKLPKAKSEAEAKGKGSQSILTFFQKSQKRNLDAAAAPKEETFTFFSERNLVPCKSF